MEFKALRIATLTKDVADDLDIRLSQLTGVTEFTITLETQEVSVKFDIAQIAFKELIDEMAKAGCSLQDINAAVLL